MKHPLFYNAHHSPLGAFASFTLGAKGPVGGLGLELKGPADEAVYVGVEDADHAGQYKALPFFAGSERSEAASEDYDVEGLGEFRRANAVFQFTDAEITREMGPAIDHWTAGDLTFRIISPVKSVPEPGVASDEDLKHALRPSLLAELTIDNRAGSRPRKAFFGWSGSDRSTGMRPLEEDGLVGLAQGLSTAIATDDLSMEVGLAFQPESILDPTCPENMPFLLGTVGMLVGVVPAGEIKTFRFAIGFFREGTATQGLTTRYLYRRWFSSVESVVQDALRHADQDIQLAERNDRMFLDGLSRDRAFQLSHSIRSYLGATQALERTDGSVLWIVNEGEYRMMNTFDLTVDQMFFELVQNPWTVRNELDFFIERYAYVDGVRFPGEEKVYPGGITFTHDMGINNVFSKPGRSGYEQAGLKGCFSYMSCEELLNWALTASIYAGHTGDSEWVSRRKETFVAVLDSLMNRDHPDPHSRNGVMGLDSDRCQGGSEITTYDSLDASLGQARNNLYLAVKSWAAYVLLGPILKQLGELDSAAAAAEQAVRCANTIVAAANSEGLLPAVLGEGVEARIIPAIEALAYPLVAGRSDLLEASGPFGELRKTLERHFDLVMKPGICLFPDGGWKLSSTSRNSWLSKIYLCQYVAENVFGATPDSSADTAHVSWLTHEDNGYFAWSDQMLAGKAVGSRYYPRGVTSVLWLGAGGRPLQLIGDKLAGKELSLKA